MRTQIAAVFFTSLLLAASLSAEQPTGSKKVWTNDDFPSATSIAKAQPLPQAVPATPNPHAPKNNEELQARLELKTKWVTELKNSLQASNDELPHTTSQEQRHGLLTKIKMIEHDLEDATAELRNLQSSVEGTRR